ncbi:MAG: hypothetical protein M1812_002672 [Candelaria pacifica]|nr:MAG: hypothetical protein M1812_002672 [Candelaria pacifica]
MAPRNDAPRKVAPRNVKITNTNKIGKRIGKWPRLTDQQVIDAEARLPEYRGLFVAVDGADLTTARLNGRTFGKHTVANYGHGESSITEIYNTARREYHDMLYGAPASINGELPAQLDDIRRNTEHPNLPFALTELYGDPRGGAGPQGAVWEQRKVELLSIVGDEVAARRFLADQTPVLQAYHDAKQEHVRAVEKEIAARDKLGNIELQVIKKVVSARAQKMEKNRSILAIDEAAKEKLLAKRELDLAEQRVLAAPGAEHLDLVDITEEEKVEVITMVGAMNGTSDHDELYLQIIARGDPHIEWEETNHEEDIDLNSFSIETRLKLLQFVRKPSIVKRYGTTQSK